MLSELFYWLFNMSISASIAGIIILLIGKVKKLPEALLPILCGLFLLRTWIPVGVSGKIQPYDNYFKVYLQDCADI